MSAPIIVVDDSLTVRMDLLDAFERAGLEAEGCASIAEARAALAADPGNDALLDVLSANYEQKVQLLRRASELPART